LISPKRFTSAASSPIADLEGPLLLLAYDAGAYDDRAGVLSSTAAYALTRSNERWIFALPPETRDLPAGGIGPIVVAAEIMPLGSRPGDTTTKHENIALPRCWQRCGPRSRGGPGSGSPRMAARAGRVSA